MTIQKVSLLRLPEVKARCGLGRTSIYELIRAQKFPKPITLLGRNVAWPSPEIDAWIDRQIARGAAQKAETLQ